MAFENTIMPTRVWLMRHGETAQPNVFHGFESDVDLSERGYRQAAALAPVVATHRPDFVFSSNMLRARKTAEPIAQACGLPLRIEPLLHERRVGSLVGQPAQPELGIWPDTLKRWIDGDTAYSPEGAESFDDLQQRLLPVWERLTTDYQGGSLVIVCHGIVCRVLLLSLLTGYTVADWVRLGRITNASISELVGDGSHWRSTRIADVPPEVREIA